MSLISRMPTPFMTSLRQISLSPSALKASPIVEEIPKKPSTPWVHYFTSKLPEFKKNNPNMRQPDIMRKISESWGLVSDQEKQKLQFIYEKEKEIYQQKIAALSENLISSKKALKAQKKASKSKKSAAYELKQLFEETNKPKKALSGYLLYASDIRPKLPKDMSPQDILKKIGNDWKNAPDSVRQEYQDRQKAESDRYQKEMTSWNKKMKKMGYAEKITELQEKVSMLKKQRVVNP